MKDSFEIEQIYHVPIATVWRALTEVELMREWYFPQIQYLEPKIGAAFEFKDDGSRYQKDWKVTRLEHNRLLAHSWQYKHFPGSSEVTFEISGQGESTKLVISHTGLASFPSDPHFSYHRFEQGWKMISGENLRRCLKQLTE